MLSKQFRTAWSNKGLSHVAFATKDIHKTLALFKDKFKISSVMDPFEFKPQGVKVAFLHLGDSSIELIEPLTQQSPISKYLAKNPNGGMHHICFFVDDIENAVDDLNSQGIRALNQPRPGALGKNVVFLHPKDTNGVLVELEEHN